MPSTAQRPASRRRGTATGANAIGLADRADEAAGSGSQQAQHQPQQHPKLRTKKSESALLLKPEGSQRQGLGSITRKVASDDNMRLSAAIARAVDLPTKPTITVKSHKTVTKKPSASTLVPSPSLPPKPAFAPGLPLKPAFVAELPGSSKAKSGKGRRGMAGAEAAQGSSASNSASTVSSSIAQDGASTVSNGENIPPRANPPAPKQYPRSLSRQVSAPLLRGAGLPPRPAFEQFPRGAPLPGGRGHPGAGKARVPSAGEGLTTAKAAAAPRSTSATASVGSSSGSSQSPAATSQQAQPAEATSRKSSGRSRGGKGRNKGVAGKQKPLTPDTVAGVVVDALAEDIARGRSDEPSPLPVYGIENVQSSSPAPLPDSTPASRWAPPSPSPANGATGAITPHRPSAAQAIPQGRRAAPTSTSAPPSPVPNSYQSLEDLLSQAGYRETRVFTPEAEKLRAQRREAEDRRKRESGLAKNGKDRPSMQAYPVDEAPHSVENATSPEFQDMATFSETSSPPVNGSSWWNALALPWSAAPPVIHPTSGPADDAVASLQNALRDHGVPAKTVRKMWSTNDVSGRSTGFNWADESLESIAEPAVRPELARHWTDAAATAGTRWDGSPVKRKRKVLNRVDLEISLAASASTHSTTSTTDDSEQSLVWTLSSDAPGLELSPTSQSDAGTIRPSKRDADEAGSAGQRDEATARPRSASTSVGSAGGFDALAYESRHSGDFEDMMDELGNSSEISSSLAGSPVRPVVTKEHALRTPSPGSSRRSSPTRPVLKHAASVPVLPCSGTAEWDILLASLPPLPPVPLTAPVKPPTKRHGKSVPPPRALTAVLSVPKQPASPMLVRTAHIVCDSNQAEDLPPLAAPADQQAQGQAPSMMRTLRSVMSLSALRYRKQEVAETPSHAREPSLALTLSPKPGLASDAQEWVPTATPKAKPHGFNVLYSRQANSPKYKYTDNVDEIEALNAAMENDYLRKEPDFTQSFFYQPPTPPKPSGAPGDATSDRREAKRQRSIKSLRAHLLKKTVSMSMGIRQSDQAVPPVPPLPAGLQKSQPQRIEDRRPPPPVFAISSPGATEAGLPPRELLLEGEEWDAGSLEGIKQREASGLVHGKRLTKRPSLKKKRSGERRA